MECIDTITPATFTQRTSFRHATVIVIKLTSQVGWNRYMLVFRPYERLVLADNRILYIEMVRRFNNQMQIERGVAVMYRRIMAFFISGTAYSFMPLVFPFHRIIIADIQCVVFLITRPHGYRQLIDGVTNRCFYRCQAIKNISVGLAQTDIIRIGSCPFTTHNNRVAPVNGIIVTDGTIGSEQIGVHQMQFQAVDTITTVDRMHLVLVIVVEIKDGITVFQILEFLIEERTVGHAVPFVGLVRCHHMVIHFQEGL